MEQIPTLTQVQQVIHQTLLFSRNIEHLINTVRFELTYLEASDMEKRNAVGMIRTNNLLDLKNWLQRMNTIDLEDRTLTALRELAGQLGIKRYSDYTKPQLITQIRRSIK